MVFKRDMWGIGYPSFARQYLCGKAILKDGGLLVLRPGVVLHLGGLSLFSFGMAFGDCSVSRGGPDGATASSSFPSLFVAIVETSGQISRSFISVWSLDA
jgi:hypothetical protein